MNALVCRFRRLRGREGGITLVELLVTTVLLGVVSAFVVAAVTSTLKEQRVSDNEAQGLSDTQTVIERLARDIRDARSVYAGADPTHLQLWIDYNSDYILDPTNQPNEIVTWQISASAGGKYNVLRQYQGGTPTVEARTLVQSAIFCYSADTSQTPAPCITGAGAGGSLTAAQAKSVKLVTATVTYDPGVAGASHARTAVFSARLRNVS